MIAVTGATGGMGGRIADRLDARGVPQRLIVRDARKAPDIGADVAVVGGYADREGMRRAFDRVETVMFVPAHEDRDRLALHRTVVEAAVEAGVPRIVYLSFVGAAPDTTFTFGRHHFHTEQLVKAAGVRWAFPRMNLYSDFLPMLAGADGIIRGPAGDGRVAGVARDDLADVCVEMLLDPGRFDGQAIGITGPKAFDLDDLATALTDVSGREVSYVPETVDEAWASRSGMAADWEVEGWITSYTAIANGDVAEVTDAVEQITGHRPKTLRQVLDENPETWAHLRG